MAELQNNPMGKLSGKLGNMVASNWRDINYLKAMAKRSNKTATDSQIEARLRFALIQEFMMQIKRVVERGFANSFTGRATAFNVAVKANKLAITGQYPELSVDYAKITLSAGALTSCLDATIEALPDAKLHISWKEPGVPYTEEMADVVTVVIYDEVRKAPATYNTFLRSEYSAEISLPASFADDTVHAWMFFTSSVGSKNSRTTYLGSVTVLA
ncbi:DUF6266 family protein [Desertivirga arenae]|uniref:DUF6266 family protein n=1 Tax=Desertivirga arenae TaxID=2810309 RepID=UPI001A95F7A4|nr:DUF6266 family protein [Pedobacter sp. SYSU D00823]